MSSKDLERLEEALIASGLYKKLMQPELDESTWPAELENLQKEIQSGRTLSSLSSGQILALTEHLHLTRSMEGSLDSVPEALLASVNRALDAEKTVAPEGIVVRLLRNGMELIQGSLTGATLELAPVAATRRGTPAEAPVENPTGSRIDLTLPVGRGQLHCSILQTSSTEAMVSLSLKNLAGTYQLSLRKDGRLIGSHSGVKSDRSVQFDRIAPGAYSVELKGKSSAQIPFSIV